MTGPTSVIVEADGGSRGNPGPAAYGALLRDATTGEVIAEDGTAIGVATNNVAEYSGLIAGLKLAEEFAPDADIEVRMDSKLVVEQMSGRWKIKHADMRPLATEANRLAPFGTTYTWIPREQNKHADRLVNEALDAAASPRERLLRLDHVVIAVSDWERSNGFYRDVLGAEILDRGDGYAYRFGDQQLNVHGPGLSVSIVARDPVRPGNSDLCFVWPGTAEEAAEHLRGHGVDVELGPVERPGARGTGRSVYFRDPDGTLLELMAYE
jgi:ribonuclease HI